MRNVLVVSLVAWKIIGGETMRVLGAENALAHNFQTDLPVSGLGRATDICMHIYREHEYSNYNI